MTDMPPPQPFSRSMAESKSCVKPKLMAKRKQQLQKTELCKFFITNNCGKGELCSFAHSLSELREKPNLDRTSMCQDFLRTGNCEDPKCRFAHCERDLRTTSAFFKTKLCRFAAKGRCKHGAACRFAHETNELNKEGILDSSVDLDMPDDGQDFASESSTTASNDERPAGGSGDSGQDDTPQSDGFVQPVATQGNLPSNAGGRGRHFTTVMLSNVPKHLKQSEIIKILEERTDNMQGRYDFFYSPCERQASKNLGYAIINFLHRTIAMDFERRWANQHLVPRANGAKPLRVVPAGLQGRAANIQHFSGFPLAQHPDPSCRPLVRSNPDEELRPMAIINELICNNRPGEAGMPVQRQDPPQHCQAPYVGGGGQGSPQAQQQQPKQNQQQQPPKQNRQQQQGRQQLPQPTIQALQMQSALLRQQTRSSEDDAYPQDPGLLATPGLPWPNLALQGVGLGAMVEPAQLIGETPYSYQAHVQSLTQELEGVLNAWSYDQTTQRLLQAAAQLQSQQPRPGQGGQAACGVETVQQNPSRLGRPRGARQFH